MFRFPGRAQVRGMHGRAFHSPFRGGPGPGPGRMGPRRPLRFLVERLGLDDTQASELAKALEALKLDREQAALDLRRAQARIADLVEGATLDRAELEAAADARVAAARRLRDATVAAVTKVHAVLKPEQRAQLAMLLRGGPLEL